MRVSTGSESRMSICRSDKVWQTLIIPPGKLLGTVLKEMRPTAGA
jgi:hypothetical protein